MLDDGGRDAGFFDRFRNRRNNRIRDVGARARGLWRMRFRFPLWHFQFWRLGAERLRESTKGVADRLYRVCCCAH